MSAIFAPADDGIRIRFGPELAAFLRGIPQMLDSVGKEGEDPAADRLRVPVYLDDADANVEWWRWMGDELDRSRATDRSAFAELVDAGEEGTVASRQEAEAFVRVLVEARLLLGARLGIEVEDDYDRLDEGEAALIGTLAELQVMLIAVLGV